VAIPLGLLAIIAVPEPIIKRQGGPDSQSSTSVLSIFKTSPSYLETFGFVGQFLSPFVFAPILILLGFKGVFLTGAGAGAVWFVLLWATRSRGAKRHILSEED